MEKEKTKTETSGNKKARKQEKVREREKAIKNKQHGELEKEQHEAPWTCEFRHSATHVSIFNPVDMLNIWHVSGRNHDYSSWGSWYYLESSYS